MTNLSDQAPRACAGLGAHATPELENPGTVRGAPGLAARSLLGFVWLYKKLISPVLPAVFGPACGCRFYPTCSQYAAGALREHGAALGVWLALRRLLKCTPLHPGGFDFVPPAGSPQRCSPRRCTRVPLSA